MSPIGGNLQAVLRRIEAAARAAGRRPDEIRLLAVSKTRPPADIEAAYQAGQRAFGESQQQEASAKIAALARLALEWHFIGPIQSNKTRPIAEQFAWIHSLDRERVARRLSEQRPPELGPLMVCIQVNVSGEASKSGVPPQAALELARQVACLRNVRLRGLMTIPAPSSEPERQRAQFRVLRTLYDAMRTQGMALDTLSMGMSDDLEAAILEGATLVRVGSAIFGRRSVATSTDT
jgi:pyridoxal phosphate enzyme (YggS family)